MTTRTRPRLTALARAWLDIGSQSFGGGPSTLFLIKRICVERHHWITLRELNESWGLAQLSPGIHLTALAGMLGRLIAGTPGVIVCVVAMMLPAALITVALTAGYEVIAHAPLVERAFSGVVPVTAGLSIGYAWPMLRTSLQRGPRAIAELALAVAALAAVILGASIIVLILVSGLIGGLLFGGREAVPDAVTRD